MKTFLKIIGIIILIFIVLNMVWKDDLDKMERDTREIVTKERYINSFVEETKSFNPPPVEVDLGTLKDIINENNESIVWVYQTTIDDYKDRRHNDKYSMISKFKSREGVEFLIDELIEMDINLEFRYYIKTTQGDSLIGIVKIEPTDWYQN